MKVHFDRLKELLKKRSIPGWVLLAVSVFWKRLGDWQNVEWIMNHWPKTWHRQSMTLHPNSITVVLFIAALVWLAVVALWPKTEKAASSGRQLHLRERPSERLVQKDEIFSPEEKERQRKFAGISDTPPKESDPLVYVEFENMRKDLSLRTPFRFRNRGHGVAHKIALNPVELNSGTARFSEVDTLDIGAKYESCPQIEGVGWQYKYDFLNLIRLEVDKLGKSADKEFVLPMSATYESVTGQEFEVSFDFFYAPLNNLLHSESEILRKVKPFYGIRNTKIRLIPS